MSSATLRLGPFGSFFKTIASVSFLFLVVQTAIAAAGVAGPASDGNSEAAESAGLLDQHVFLGWNDLGMHCSNKFFADLAVLPPYNTVWAQLILRGTESTPPVLLGAPNTVGYRIEDNTYSVGKTDFWSWEDLLFGVQLPDNIGLAGKGLTGSLDWTADRFEAIGIPLTPYTDFDLVNEQPYQIGLLEARDDQGGLLATTEIVVPVSNEMMCSNCHHPQGGETVEQSILRLHDSENGTQLMANRPVLCANCHGSNALGMPGNPELPNLSLAMHQQHAEHTEDCYQCHPGPNTQCLRDVMSQQHNMVCQDCHGSVAEVALSIEQGRRPWLDEPRCGGCHGANYSEPPGVLYRNANNGHGGLYCEACHSSPHAILPSREERDNRQVMALQGVAGTLRDCRVCHGVNPAEPGPHGLMAAGLADEAPPAGRRAQISAGPNPFATRTEISYRVAVAGPVRLAIHDAKGRTIRVLADAGQSAGDHALVWDGRSAAGAPTPAGVYFCELTSGGQAVVARLVKLER